MLFLSLDGPAPLPTLDRPAVAFYNRLYGVRPAASSGRTVTIYGTSRQLWRLARSLCPPPAVRKVGAIGHMVGGGRTWGPALPLSRNTYCMRMPVEAFLQHLHGVFVRPVDAWRTMGLCGNNFRLLLPTSEVFMC